MSAAVATIIDLWAIPRMNSHVIRASALHGNGASVRVLEKAGFVVTNTVEACVEVRGEMRGVHWLLWIRKRRESGQPVSLVAA
jgi:RimJ/RimL family protein N-acetyltransferase